MFQGMGPPNWDGDGPRGFLLRRYAGQKEPRRVGAGSSLFAAFPAGIRTQEAGNRCAMPKRMNGGLTVAAVGALLLILSREKQLEAVP